MVAAANCIRRHDLILSSCQWFPQYVPHAMFTTQLNGNNNAFEKNTLIDSQSEFNSNETTSTEMSLEEQKELLRKLNLHRIATKAATEVTSPRSLKDRIIDNTVISGFSALGLLPRIVDSLSSQGFSDPTPVQKTIIPRILNKESIVMAASTGSGKTFAFILPVINQLLMQASRNHFY